MESLWRNDIQLPAFDPLDGSTKTDALVIGGGISGILCAYALKQAGVNVIVVEQNKICSGVTSNTTAKITSQHGLIYDKLLKKFGAEKAGKFLRANQEAIDQYRRLCVGIDCDFEEKDAVVYSCNNKQALEKELKALEALGFLADYLDELPLPFSTVGGIRFQKQAQFHPLKFLSSIAQKLNIYEDTKVLELMPGIVRTNRGTIHAKAIIIATHFPMLNRHGSYFLKLYQQRSYVLALENAQNIDGMYIGAEYPNLSLRNYKDLLLFGGCGYRTGKQGGGWQELSYYAHRYYPKSTASYKWATQDCMTLDAVPYIGQYSKNTEGLYVATGFQKWGMTTAMVASEVLKDMILEKENPYADLFCPSRSILTPQLVVNGFEAFKNLLSFRTPRCPHLGCALKWNPQEHSWDCSCHGSRFSENGKVLNNPATDDMKIKRRSR